MSLKHLKQIYFSPYKKMALIWGFFVLGLLLFFGMRWFGFLSSSQKSSLLPSPTPFFTKSPSPTSFPLVGKMQFGEVLKRVKINDEFLVKVEIAALGKILDGADLYLSFEPAYLKVEEIIPGDYFLEYPRQSIEEEKGLVKLTAFKGKEGNPLEKNIVLASLRVRALKKGETNLKIVFETGKTNLSNVVEKGSSRNILGKVEEAKIIIE